MFGFTSKYLSMVLRSLTWFLKFIVNTFGVLHFGVKVLIFLCIQIWYMKILKDVRSMRSKNWSTNTKQKDLPESCSSIIQWWTFWNSSLFNIPLNIWKLDVCAILIVICGFLLSTSTNKCVLLDIGYTCRVKKFKPQRYG